MIQTVHFYPSTHFTPDNSVIEKLPNLIDQSSVRVNMDKKKYHDLDENKRRALLDEVLTTETFCLAQSLVKLSTYQKEPLPSSILEFTVEQLKSIIGRAIALYGSKSQTTGHARCDDIAIENHSGHRLVNNVISVIEDNIENDSLNVTIICRKLGKSRTDLYNKLKQLTGKSIGEFIRTIRLSRAAYLLAHENVSVTEVMYQVGIRSRSYFTRFFKKKYGISPYQYARQMRSHPPIEST